MSFCISSADANLRLSSQGNILHRIGDVLRFERVDVSIGFYTGAISFQRCYLPLLQFFSSDLMLKSTRHKNIKCARLHNYFISLPDFSSSLLYAMIKNNHEHVFDTLQKCLHALIQAKSWKDQTPNLSASLQNTLDGMTTFRTLSTIFLQ